MLLLGGLLVWASHFFLAYAFASVFPGSDTARWLTIGATIVALAANAVIVRLALGAPGRRGDLDAWIMRVAAAGAVLSIVAVVWQAFPAIV